MRTVALCGRDDAAYPAEQAAVARREGERRRPTCRPVALAAASSSPIADCLIALYAKKASGAAAEGVLESAARAEARKCGLEGRQQQVYRDNSKLCLQVAPCVRLQPELGRELGRSEPAEVLERGGGESHRPARWTPPLALPPRDSCLFDRIRGAIPAAARRHARARTSTSSSEAFFASLSPVIVASGRPWPRWCSRGRCAPARRPLEAPLPAIGVYTPRRSQLTRQLEAMSRSRPCLAAGWRPRVIHSGLEHFPRL